MRLFLGLMSLDPRFRELPIDDQQFVELSTIQLTVTLSVTCRNQYETRFRPLRQKTTNGWMGQLLTDWYLHTTTSDGFLWRSFSVYFQTSLVKNRNYSRLITAYSNKGHLFPLHTKRANFWTRDESIFGRLKAISLLNERSKNDSLDALDWKPTGRFGHCNFGMNILACKWIFINLELFLW